ncbi:MAG: signal peptidase II [Planctomycetota bacterium]|nr:signal peptidase II [Planctomycetota bacterium]MDA1112918.1 signal peptidase II [Planctomycetota bacterium]
MTESQLEESSKGLLRPAFWIFVLGLLVIDLVSKSWAFSEIGTSTPPRPILGEWLSFFCITNSGGIWGAGNNGGFTGILTIVRLIAVGVLILFVKRQADANRMGLFTLGLLIAGALGNLYDNLSAWMPWDLEEPGKVRDFVRVDFNVPGWWPEWLGWPFHPFPIFNFADACISVGFVLLITGLAKLRLNAESEDSTASSK